MATRKHYNREPRYKDVARNEAADLEASIASLSLWISEHPNADAGLIELFNRKIDVMLEYHDLCTEIINYNTGK